MDDGIQIIIGARIMNPRVIILGRYDLIERKYLKNILNLNEKKTFRKGKLITNEFTFDVDNYDDFFSVEKSGSGLHGTNWRYSTIEVYNEDNIKTWEGIIIDILRIHKTKKAKVFCKNSFFSFRKDIVNYQSSDWETGATAFKNICDSVNFEKYNEKAWGKSNDRLTDENCLLKCNFNTEDSVNFMDAVKKVAEYSNADLYVHLDELYFEHWQEFSGGVTITIEGDRRGEFKRSPEVDSPDKDIINDFAIDYDESGETPATDSNSDNIGEASREKFRIRLLPGFRTGSNGQIIFKDKISAKYIGNSYIRKTNRNLETNPEPPTRAKFSIFSRYKRHITLGTYFRVNFSEESWDEKNFETFEFTINEEKDEISIEAYGV